MKTTTRNSRITSPSAVALAKAGHLSLFTVLAALGFVALAPTAQAVVPAPDGGYPGGNTAEGQDALHSLSSGTYNTGVGWFSLRANTAGNFNTAIGAGALFANTADGNTATGAGALLFNNTGSQNTANGAFALFNNTIGGSNSAIGFDALFSNTDGSGNTATGAAALFSNTTGGGNTALGAGTLFANTTGGGNTAVGVNAYSQEDDGQNNTAIGVNAGSSCTGNQIENNTSVGANAYGGCTRTTTIGANASGGLMLNTVVGFQANGGDTGNTVIGAFAGSNLAPGAFNDICIGAFAGSNLGSAFNVISIGADGQNVDDSCYIGNIWNQPGGSQAVYVNSDGKLGFQTSSRRFKDGIKPIECASEVIYELKPVSFRYKSDIEPTRPRGFGLIAEDVQKINPELVMRDADGKPASVRYDAVNAMLLNEFLKEHKKVQELEATIARQEKGMEVLAVQLKKQATQIHKVSAQIGLSKSSMRTALTDQ